ncbi:acyl carrier protein [Sphingomonas longa]|jgi:acyl carrier protein|nr:MULTISPECIES: acyl carrier protein [Alphaproteobacteria]
MVRFNLSEWITRLFPPNPPAAADCFPHRTMLAAGNQMKGSIFVSDDILSRVQSIMADTFDDDDLTVTADTTAADVEDWDSLSHIRLVVAIEREFGIKFSNAEIEGLQNVGDLVRAIEAKQGA